MLIGRNPIAACVSLIAVIATAVALVGCSGDSGDASESEAAFDSIADEAYAQGPYKGVSAAALQSRVQSLLGRAIGVADARCASPPTLHTDPTTWYLGTPMESGLSTLCTGAEQWWAVQCASPNDCYFSRDPAFYGEAPQMKPLDGRP